MSWFKVIVGFALMIGVVIAWYRIMQSLRGPTGSGMDLSVGKKRRGRAEDANELERFVAAHRAGAADGGAKALPPTATPTLPAPPVPAPKPLLEGPDKLAYLIFKAALREHAVFARVSLATVAPDVPAPLQHTFPLVICRADFRVIAAVDLDSGIDAMRIAAIGRHLADAGIRHIVLDAKKLPKPVQIAALLAGD
ncbi:MAG: hypothetical protein KIT73_18600 [Burkholderiales bacterium]|nr:hypothetical protein [Burkholderiales bacterium]